MSPSELEAFLAELEPDIRAADRDMREIEMLEKKGVTGAGKLPGPSAHPHLLPLPARASSLLCSIASAPQITKRYSRA